MGDARIVYGLALGKQNNWKALWQQKTHGAITQADTSPDVTNGCLFYTVNTGATTISHFDLTTPAGTTGDQSGLFEGKVIKIVFTDSVTTVSGSRMYLAGTNNTFNTNAVLDLIYHNSAWYEVSRSNPPGKNHNMKSQNIGSSTDYITVTNDFGLYAVVATAAGAYIRAISGGYDGQSIAVLAGSNGWGVDTAGNIIMFGTAALVMPTSQGFTATRINGSWITNLTTRG